MNIKKALEFLQGMYNPETSLCAEAPRVNPNLYWLKIDNWLIELAARTHKCDKLRNNIADGLLRYHHYVQGRIEVLAGGPLDQPFKLGRHKLVTADGDIKIMVEVADGDVIKNWTDFADLLVYKIINLHKKGGIVNRFRRYYYTMLLKRMWNGNGFADVIAKKRGDYCTYKLALYLIMRRILNYKTDDKISKRCREIIKSCQSLQGGIYTDYYTDRGGVFVGDSDMNTETTAFCLLAQKRREA